MKKAITYMLIFTIFILVYILQSNFFTWFNIAGVQPNLFIMLILFCGLFTGKMSGLICGVLFGILLDLFIQTSVVIEPIMLGTLGFASGILAKNFSKESRFNIMVMVVATTFLYELGVYLLKIFVYNSSFEILPFIKVIFIEMIYNAMITIIIYPLIQYCAQKIEEKLMENKILRYF